MANTTLNMTLLLRRAAFTDSCLLKEGEPGYHTGTHELKIGQKDTNGDLVQWKDLPIANKSQIDTLISNAIAAHAAGYYTKQQVDDLLLAANSAINKVKSDLAAEVTARESADNALDSRLDTVEAKLTNVSNVMDFVGAKTALPAEGSNQSGDVVVITAGDNAGKEFVYDDSRETGKKWVEFGSTSATDSAVADLKSRMEAAETGISKNGSAIITLGTTKLDAATFNSFNNGTSKSVSAIEDDIVSKANAAKSGAITEAGKLDAALHTTISAEINADVKAGLTAAQTYADTVAANAVKNNITADNTDIVITRPTSGDNKDKTVISHKAYGTGTYTKPDSVSDANFVTGINIENGHVTGASIKSLAEALSAMTFIFDGGTSAN